MTLSITMLYHYAECHFLFITTLNVILLSVIMLSVMEPQILLHMSTMPCTYAHSPEHFPYQPHDKTSSPVTRELHGWSLHV